MPSYFALLSSEELELLPSSSLGNLGFAGPVPILCFVKSPAPHCPEESRTRYLAAISAVAREEDCLGPVHGFFFFFLNVALSLIYFLF